jgi:hypothetical protein
VGIGRYENALRVMTFNTAEGWSRDVSEDIPQELLQRAINAGDYLGEGAQRFVDRHVTHRAPAAQLGAIKQFDRLRADFEKRPPAPSVRRGRPSAFASGRQNRAPNWSRAHDMRSARLRGACPNKPARGTQEDLRAI